MSFRTRGGTGDPLPSFEALRTVLSTASDLAERLHGDPLMGRWISAFEAMPVDDRATVLDVVERDVAFRVHSAAGEDLLSGFRTARPNPNARLYSRVFEQDEVPFLPFDHLVASIVHGARLTHRSLAGGPPDTPEWRDALVAACEALTSEEIDSVVWTNRLVLEIAERVQGARRMAGG